MKFSRSFPFVTFVVLTDCRLQCNLLSTVLSHERRKKWHTSSDLLGKSESSLHRRPSLRN